MVRASYGPLRLVPERGFDRMPGRVQYLARHLDDGGVLGCLIEKLASAGHPSQVSRLHFALACQTAANLLQSPSIRDAK